jgi:hypothetical protein
MAFIFFPCATIIEERIGIIGKIHGVRDNRSPKVKKVRRIRGIFPSMKVWVI